MIAVIQWAIYEVFHCAVELQLAGVSKAPSRGKPNAAFSIYEDYRVSRFEAENVGYVINLTRGQGDDRSGSAESFEASDSVRSISAIRRIVRT